MIRVHKEVFQRFPYAVMEVNVQKVETAICLEAVVRVCCQAMAESIHNGRIGLECQLFAKEAMLSQNHLRQFLVDREASQRRITQMYQDCYDVNPPCLSPLGLIEVALRSCLEKVHVYKYLSRTTGSGPRRVFDKAIIRTLKEIKFLKSERAFQEGKELMPPWLVFGACLSG